MISWRVKGKMSDIDYKIISNEDVELFMKVRLEMLREVNNLPDDYIYDDEFVDMSRKYFMEGNQTTILAFDNKIIVGCATMSYIWIMPTFSHPSGKRAHLMNVYTRADYRRRGISKKMIEMLIDEARAVGATEISLDATEMGRPLYETLGFVASPAGMVMELT